MKKQLLSLFSFATLALGVSAAAPEAVWDNLIDGSTAAGDQSTSISLDADGNVYWYGTYGTTAAAPDVTYAGEFLFKGAPYDAGTSYGSNYTLLKTDAQGNKLWCVYSNSGDFASNSGFSATTSDGGVITVSKVRHTDGMLDTNIRLVNADGTPFEIDWTCDRRYYRMAITKISAGGQIEWNRMVDFSTQPGPAASGNSAEFWAETFNVSGGTVDDEGNIYIALNYRNPMTVARKDGEPAVFTPSNTGSWTGDTQTACGDYMLLSFDKDGWYRNNLQLTGQCAASYCQEIVWADGKLYSQGYITGDGHTMKVGAFDLAPSDVMSPLVICADADLNVSWAKCFPAEKVQNKSGLQNVGISLVNGGLYLCGQYNIKFSDPDDPAKFVAATQGSDREGFVLKLDPATGAWLAARDSRDDDWDRPSAVAKTGLTGYFDVLANPADAKKIYVFGYVMNANVGVFLREYDAETIVACLPEGQYNIVTGGGVPSCQCAAVDPDTGAMYLTARGNNTFTLLGGDTTPKPAGWGILAARFDLGQPQTNIVETIASPDPDQPVEYYDLLGRKVANPTHGLYIRRHGPTTTKVLL
ncbi:MAG: hypothetical protein K2K49_05400 [Duncaniella sp.]|nr:hypothetical protein [Duncaniella sp.]